MTSQDKPYCLGLMSGTSLDGVDVALCRIHDDKVTLVASMTVPYEDDYKARISRALARETARLDEISELNFSLAHRFAMASLALLSREGVKTEDVRFIASHGQTVWHDPHPQQPLRLGNTLQIGSPAVLAHETGIRVISDFRSADVARGGEGAPLVPMTELVLYGEKGVSQAFLNIGGIANVTYLPASLDPSDVKAFDTGPGNVLIDGFMRRYYDKPYDDGGLIASRGKVIDEMLAEILANPAVTKTPPKSTGREVFSEAYMDRLAARYDLSARPADALATVTHATSDAVCLAITSWLPPLSRLVVSGGGCHNTFLMSLLAQGLTARVMTGREAGIDPDSKEAVAFAELGLLTLLKRPGSIPSVTGATGPAVLGSITPGKDDE